MYTHIPVDNLIHNTLISAGEWVYWSARKVEAMESKIGKAAGIGTTASMRAGEMMVQMAQSKARAAAAQVKLMRQKAKAFKKALKKAKKAARQARKALKATQSAFEISKTKTKSGNKEVREPKATSTAARLATVRPRRKRPVLKKAPVVEIALQPPNGSQPADQSGGAASTVSGPNEARP